MTKENNVIGKCPCCGEKLQITELTCKNCDTVIRGKFTLSKFNYLTPAQQNFALIFIKNAGNIKLIEKDLNVSYPTVKKNIDELISSLGFNKINTFTLEKPTKEEIYKMLKNKEITFDEAEEMLKEE